MITQGRVAVDSSNKEEEEEEIALQAIRATRYHGLENLDPTVVSQFFLLWFVYVSM